MFLADYNSSYEYNNGSSAFWSNDSASFGNGSAYPQPGSAPVANWWALSALSLVVATAAGNILVCLAICWERRLQNVTNYFLMSLAVTDLMVAILVMPLGIYTLFRGYFALPSIYCLAWICLDVLFCTASIMHLCTISVDRYLSLRYPMKFGRNKSRRRVILKIVFVWLLSIAMSLPLSLMYSKDQGSLIIDGTCQIPDPLYKFIGSIICFYIPLLVMLVTYALTVRLLANQKQSLGTPDWSSNWMGGPNALERRCTWRRFFHTTTTKPGGRAKHHGNHHQITTPQHHGGGHHHSAASTDTELTALDTHELWIQESEPKPCAMSALGAFGAEMLKLSRGLQEAAAAAAAKQEREQREADREKNRPSPQNTFKLGCSSRDSLSDSRSPLLLSRTASSETATSPRTSKRLRRASTYHSGDSRDDTPTPRHRRRFGSVHEVLLESGSSSGIDSTPQETPIHRPRPPGDSLLLPPPCKCPYFGDQPPDRAPPQPAELKIVPSDRLRIMAGGGGGGGAAATEATTITPGSRRRLPGDSSPNLMVTWESRRSHRRGSSFGATRSILVTNNSSPLAGGQRTPLMLRRSATLRQNGHSVNVGVVGGGPGGGLGDRAKNPSSPCLLQRYAFNNAAGGGKGIRPHHSRNSSVISRNSSRHGRIIRLEQKATKVLGVVFFTFVILWAPFFILNLLPTFCDECDKGLDNWAVQLVTWLGYASSMVNPVFYTIFNKVFRQAFKKVLTCKYRKSHATWRPHR